MAADTHHPCPPPALAEMGARRGFFPSLASRVRAGAQGTRSNRMMVTWPCSREKQCWEHRDTCHQTTVRPPQRAGCTSTPELSVVGL